MSTPNNLTNSGVSASGEVPTLLIEKFIGKVHEEFLKGENIMSYFDLQSVVGTNMVSNKYFGETQVQVLAPGQSPEATDTDFDKNALVVDTSLIARNTVAHIHDVQNDIDGLKSKLAANQAKQLKKVEDKLLCQQLIFGGFTNFQAGAATAPATGGRAKPRVSGHGFSINVPVDATKATTKPNYLMAAIEYAIEKQLEQEVEVNELIILMPWADFNCLRDAERIVNTRYTTSTGTDINGFTLKSYNIPVVPTNRFPSAADVAAVTAGKHSLLSNKNNGYRYDATTGMDKVHAVIFQTDALLVGRTIDVTGDIFYDKKEKTYYIDTFMAEGAIPDRWESVSVVHSASNEADTVITARAARKAVVTTTA